jgi:hypothetical protein
MTVSRRSNSTPTKATESPRDLLPIEQTLLSATGRKIKIRQDGSDREVSVADAIIQRQVQSALTGSTHAQGQILKGIFRAERARAKIIKSNVELGKCSKELAQERVEKAIKQGEDSDLVTPHPDDYRFSQDKGWTLQGPWDQAQLEIILDNCRLRDLMVMQATLEERLATKEEWRAADDRIEDRPDASSWVTAHLMNDGLPERFKLNDFQLDKLQISYMRLTTRELLKATRSAWRRSGQPKPRGWRMDPWPVLRRRMSIVASFINEVFVSVGAGKPIDIYALAKEMVAALEEEKVDA